MRETIQLASILGGLDIPEYAFSTPAFMPSTGTKGKKHVNRFKLSRKLRKKHRKAARNR